MWVRPTTFKHIIAAAARSLRSRTSPQVSSPPSTIPFYPDTPPHQDLPEAIPHRHPQQNPSQEGLQNSREKPPSNPPFVVRRTLFNDKITLPPPLPPHKNTIFLGLDETLVHSIATMPPERYDFMVRPVIDNEKAKFYVLKMPFVDEFLAYLSGKFEIIVFTAGIEEYASLVLDKLDWRKAISYRPYHDSCKAVDGKFVKDLGETGGS